MPSGLIWLIKELYTMRQAGKISDAEARWILAVAYGETIVQWRDHDVDVAASFDYKVGYLACADEIARLGAEVERLRAAAQAVVDEANAADASGQWDDYRKPLTKAMAVLQEALK